MRTRTRALQWLIPSLCLLLAPTAQAIPFLVTLDPGQSEISQGGSASPLSGDLTLDLGATPPPGSNTTLDVVSLSLAGGGLTIGLDPGLANPGAGVLFTDGTFLIPTLSLQVDGIDLTLTNVTGSLAVDAACGGALCLQTAAQIDPGPGGLIDVTLVATASEIVPEPASAALVALSFLMLAAGRARRRS